LSISSKQYAKPLTIELAQPVYAVLIAVVVHLSAGLALLLSSLPVALSWAGLAIIAASGYLVMFRLRYLRRLVWRADGTWLLTTRNGPTVIAKLAADSLALSFVMLLNFHSVSGRKHFSVVIFPTAENAEALRKLRVRLRVDAGAART